MFAQLAKFHTKNFNSFPKNKNHYSIAQRTRAAPSHSQIGRTVVSKISNGMRVATETMYGETATIGVFVNTGSSFESPENNGVAHFLEHLAFKGTQKRTQKSLEIEIENMGGSLNAYTTREHTVYLAKVFKNDIANAVDILSDIIQNSEYKPENIEYERGVILREMEEVNKNKEEVIFDNLHQIAFQGTSLSFTILGPKENIEKFKRNDFVKYIQTHYTADRMIVVGAGAVEHNQLASLVEDKFVKLPKESSVDYKVPVYSGSSIVIPDDNATSSPTVDAVIAYQGTAWTSADHIPFLVIQSIVGCYDKDIGGGKNLSSKLGEIIATNQLAEKFNSFNTCYNLTGLFGAYFTTTPEKVEELCCETISEYVRIAHGVSDAEVELAKNKLKSTLLLSLDGTTQICEEIGRQLLTTGRRIPPEELFARIDAVNADIVRDVAMRYLTDIDPVTVAMGSSEFHYPEYEKLRAWTSWNSPKIHSFA